MPEVPPVNIDSNGILDLLYGLDSQAIQDSQTIQDSHTFPLDNNIFLNLLRDSQVFYENSLFNIHIEIDPNMRIIYYPEDRPPSPYPDDENILYYEEEELFPNPGDIEDLEEFSHLLQPLQPLNPLPNNLLQNFYNTFPVHNPFPNIFEPIPFNYNIIPPEAVNNLENLGLNTNNTNINSNNADSNSTYPFIQLPIFDIDNNDFNTIFPTHDNLYSVLMNTINILGNIMENIPENVEVSNLTQEQIDKIPCKICNNILDSSVFKTNECIICYEEYKANDKCRILNCKHIFHQACIDKWLLENSNTCPLCKKICGNQEDIIIDNSESGYEQDSELDSDFD